MKKTFLALLISLPLWASPPDCQTSYLFSNTPGSQADGVTTFITTGVTPLWPNANGCNSWAVLVNVSGLSASSTTFQSANAGGTRSTFLGTTVSGSNPSTTTTSTVFLATGYYPYTAISVGTMTGVGSIKVTIFGWLSPAYLASATTMTAAQIVAKFSGTPDGTKFLRDDGTLATAGGASPAGLLGAVNGSDGAGAFIGDASVIFEQVVAGTVPTAQVASVGTDDGATYTYEIVFNYPVSFGPSTGELTTTHGANALSAMNYSNITSNGTNPVSCPSGATTFAVFRSAGPGNTGRLPDGTCGMAYHDTSDSAVDGHWWPQMYAAGYGATDMSKGFRNSFTYYQPDQGDVAWQSYWGTPATQFIDEFLQDLTTARYVFAARGDPVNAFAGTLLAATELTGSNSANSIMGYWSAVAGGSGRAIVGQAENAGASNIDTEAIFGYSRSIGSGAINEAHIFAAAGGGGGGGMHTYKAFVDSSSGPADTKNYSFYSSLDLDGTKNYSFYSAGTAPAHVTGDVEVGSLTYNGHACSLVANVVTCP